MICSSDVYDWGTKIKRNKAVLSQLGDGSKRRNQIFKQLRLMHSFVLLKITYLAFIQA